MSIRVRFAPSPTGYVHIGSLRTALYNYLYAKQNKGAFVLRIEDTDRSRYVEGALENLLEALNWASISYDEGVFLENGKMIEKGQYGPYTQSERLDIYQEYIKKLLDQRHAYHCFCSKERLDEVRGIQKSKGLTPMYDRHCLGLSEEEVDEKLIKGDPYVIRLKVPERESIQFNDLVRGQIAIDSSEIDDQVLIKSDGFPTYHFAVVVDDHLMRITHIVRGEEWLTSTPKQVALYKYFGWEVPQFVHLPTVLNKDKKKLSKRQGDVSVSDFKQKGYLPEALINYLALVGWSPKDNQEIFSMEELVKEFSFQRVSNTGGVFDIEKLNWVNNQHIKKTGNERLFDLCLKEFVAYGKEDKDTIIAKKDWYCDIIELVKEKLDYLSQIKDHIEIFFGEEVTFEDETVIDVLQQEHVKRLLNAFRSKLMNVKEVDSDFASTVFNELKKETGAKGKALFMPIRAAVTGQLHGSDLGRIFVILGKNAMLKRIEYVLDALEE